MRITVATCAVLALAALGAIQAQVPACSAGLVALPDSVAVEPSIRVARVDFGTLSDVAARTVATVIAAAFVPPLHVSWPAFQVVELPGQRVTAYPVVAGEYRLRSAKGTSAVATIKASSLVPSLDSAVLRAISAAGGLAEVRALLDPDVEYAFFLTPTDVPPISARLQELKVPRYVVERPLRDREGNGAHAGYTLPASSPSASGGLTAWLVVDEKGTARRETLQVLFSAARYLETDARPFLFSRYRPTVIGGCPVATLIIRRLEFRVP